jgi:hypothetical protein
MTTITFDTSENLAQTLYQFAQTKQQSLNEALNEIVQMYFLSTNEIALIQNDEKTQKKQALMQLIQTCATLPTIDPRTADEILGYAESEIGLWEQK